MMDTKIGQSHKADPADVAKTGFDAMVEVEESVVHGLRNKMQAAVAAVAPQGRKCIGVRRSPAPDVSSDTEGTRDTGASALTASFIPGDEWR